MKKNFEHKESRGLPGGPNEYITHISQFTSTDGYKADSPDVNNPYNIIQSGNITMKGVEFPVAGMDNLGNRQIMMPDMNYQFPGDSVLEVPLAQGGAQDRAQDGTEVEETTWGDYLNPMNWGVSDRDDDGDFKQAFRASRVAGEDNFMWQGNRYSTELDNSAPKPIELNIDGLKKGISQAESLGGVLMKNSESTATGLYGQRFSELKGKDIYKGSRDDFAKDIEAQNRVFEIRLNKGIDGKRGLLQDAEDLYGEYKPQIENFEYSKEDLIALTNFLGRQGTRNFLGYHVRDGKSLAEALPNLYGSNAKQANKKPLEYLKIVRDNYQYAGEIPIREIAEARDNTNYVNPNIRFLDEEYIEDAPKPVTAPITESILNPNEDVKLYQDIEFVDYKPKFIEQVAESTAVALPYQDQLNTALLPEVVAEWEKDQEIAGVDFVDLRDSITSKFVSSVNEYGETVYKDYSNKPEEEVKELQQSLIAEGYDVGSTKDDGIYGSKTQKAYNAFVEDKNLNLGSIDRYYKKYSGSNKDEVLGIQTKLIEEGFLPVENEYGRANADGKFGERTKNALQEYNTSQEEEDSNALIFDFIPSTLDEKRCAAGMCTILENNNIQTEAIGVKFKDAWDIFDNMKTAGNSEVIFNIYDESEFDNMSKEMSVSELKAKTNSVKSRKQTKKSDYKVGDIIGIYWPGSEKHEETLKKDSEGDYLSKTYNTHTGFVSDIDEEGTPIITHNVGGNVRQQPYTQLQTAWISRPNKNIKLNRTYEVPELPIPEVASNVILNLEQKWGASIPDSRVPVIQNIVARADYNAANIPQMLNSSVDPDWLRAATVAITGVESGVGKDDSTPRTIDQARSRRGGLTGLAYDYKGKEEKDISLGVGKVKFSTIDNFAKEFFNINSLEDLADDNKSIDVISYRLTKNYELFKDYAKQYPQLGLTDTDIKNMSILSHNQGNNKLLMIGKNNENTLSADKEIEELRKLYKGTINDVSSTDYRFLPAGEEIYNTALWTGFESEAKPYIRKVNDYMQEVFPSNETVIDPGAIANNKPPTTPFAKTVMAKGGEYGVFNNYINGDYDNTPREKYASDLYDKLNRIHYKDAKALNMSPANYILTHILNKA